MALNRPILFAVLAGGVLIMSSWVIGQFFSEGLPVGKFPELPEAVASDLVRRGCTIVPDRARRNGQNVIRGEFAEDGQIDWAVLCRRGNEASILVYWAGKSENPGVLETRSSVLGQDPEAARTIGVVSPGRIRGFATRPLPAALSRPEVDFTHSGIEDALGMGSTILYYRDGQWLKIPGAD